MATKDITDRQVVAAYRLSIVKRQNNPLGNWPDEILHAITGQSIKVCHRACERAQRRGLIECGISLRSGWLTDKGLELVGF